MFERRELDLFATNKPTLIQMSDQMPGARVLDGRWGVEHIAIAIPVGSSRVDLQACKLEYSIVSPK